MKGQNHTYTVKWIQGNGEFAFHNSIRWILPLKTAVIEIAVRYSVQFCAKLTGGETLAVGVLPPAAATIATPWLRLPPLATLLFIGFVGMSLSICNCLFPTVVLLKILPYSMSCTCTSDHVSRCFHQSIYDFWGIIQIIHRALHRAIEIENKHNKSTIKQAHNIKIH